MKVLLVDDNRDFLNWGCRATSIALHRILAGSFTVQDVINKKTVDNRTPLTFLPFNHFLLNNKKYKQILKIASLRQHKGGALDQLFAKLLGFKEYLVDVDSYQSAERLIHYKRYYDELEEIYQKVKATDLVIINGEGSMIFTTPIRKDLLFQLMIIALSNLLKKQVFYVNAMVSDCPLTGRNMKSYVQSLNMLEQCAGVTVRDPHSQALLEESGYQVGAKYIPDALFSWYRYYNNKNITESLPEDTNLLIPHPENEDYLNKWAFDEPYICISDGSLPPKTSKSKGLEAFINLVKSIKGIGLPVYLVNTGGNRFIYEVAKGIEVAVIPSNINIMVGGFILANAAVFISGRYHPSIMASLGGTPSIFLTSNSHKTVSLQEMLGYDRQSMFSTFPGKTERDTIVQLTEEYLDRGDSLRDNVKSRAKKLSKESFTLTEHINKKLLSKGVHSSSV